MSMITGGKKKKTKIREEKGITLIALVVTIIILLILAGVSIQMILGDQGLIKKAVDAAVKSEIADYEEQLELLGVDVEMDDTVTGQGHNGFLDRYKDKIEENFPEAQVTPKDDDSLVVETDEGHIYEVTEEGTDYLGERGDEGLEEVPDNIEEDDIQITWDPSEGTWAQSVDVTIEIIDDNLEQFDIEYSEGDEATWHEYTEPFPVTKTETIKARLTNKIGETVEYPNSKEITNIDTIEPGDITISEKIKTDSIEVTASVTDGVATNDSGQSGIAKICFKKEDEEWIEQPVGDETAANAQASCTYTFKELTQSHGYNIQVKAIDKAGNENENQENIETEKVPGGTNAEGKPVIRITPVPDNWTNESVKVTISTTEQGYTLQYKKSESEDWTIVPDQATTCNFSVENNCTIIASLTDGKNVGEYATCKISNIDRKNPTVKIDNVTATTNTITVQATADDGSEESPEEQSGVNKIEFYYNTNDGTNWIEPQIETDGVKDKAQVTHTFSGLTQGSDYKVKVIAYDEAGNHTEVIKDEKITTEKVPNINGESDITFTFDPDNWTNKENAHVMLKLNEEIEGKIEGKFKLQYQTLNESDSVWKDYKTEGFNITQNGTINARLIETNGSQTGTEATRQYTFFDRMKPTVTLIASSHNTNSITVEATAQDEDSGSGLHNTEPYTFAIYKGNEVTSDPVQQQTASTTNTAIFSNLDQGTAYTVKVVVKDNAGNTEEETVTETTEKVPDLTDESDITFTFEPNNWTNEENAHVTLTLIKNIGSEFKLQYQTPAEDNKDWRDYAEEEGFDITTNGIVKARIAEKDGTQGGKEVTKTYSYFDRENPTVTLEAQAVKPNSITVEATAQDETSGSGLIETGTYTFSIYNGSDTTGEAIQTQAATETNTATFNDLNQGTTYTVKVVVKDNAGNTEEETVTETTVTVPDLSSDSSQDAIVITCDPPGPDWTNNNVNVEITSTYTTQGYGLQYAKNYAGNDQSVTWEDYKGPFDVIENQTIGVRLIYGTQYGKGKSYPITWIDKVVPELTINDQLEVTTNSIKVNVTANDDSSGLADSNPIKYYIIKGNLDLEGAKNQKSSVQKQGTNQTYTFTGLEQETEYTILVEATDNAGNTAEKITTGTTGKVPIPTVGTTGENEDITVSYAPPTWTSGSVDVTITKKEGKYDSFNIQYVTKSKGETPGDQEVWQIYQDTPITVSDNETTVYVRLWDGKNGGEYATATVANIDKNPPSPVSIAKSETIEPTETTIDVTATAQDADKVVGVSGVSGIAKFEFYYKNTNEDSDFTLAGTETISPPTESTDEVTQAFQYTDLETDTNYTLRVDVSDQAENKTQSKTIDIATQSSQPLAPPSGESCVSYYADVDGNGSVDGVIYADLSVGGSGTWNPGNQTDQYAAFTIPRRSGFKNYYVEKKDYSDDFGTGDVLAPVEGSVGAYDRFYVMALDDVGGKEYYWYYSAEEHQISQFMNVTSTGFGKGKTNTGNMITAWNNSKYGSRDGGGIGNDMWGLDTVQTKYKEVPTWFVPSSEEWAAFGSNLKITKSNYRSMHLGDVYWTSSITSFNGAGIVGYNRGCIEATGFAESEYVRLSVTF